MADQVSRQDLIDICRILLEQQKTLALVAGAVPVGRFDEYAKNMHVISDRLERILDRLDKE